MIAARYYRDSLMLAGAREAPSGNSESHDYINHFTRLTHDFAAGETSVPLRVTAPPQ
jgi:hypothetical protein